jgi:amino acid transporter
MLVILGAFLGVIVASTAFALVGVRIGAQMEAKKLGAGITEEQMKGGFTASGLGGLLGIIPVLIFVGVLVVIVLTTPEEHPTDGSEPAPAAAAH